MSVRRLGDQGWTWTREPAQTAGPTAGGLRWRSHPRADYWRVTDGVVTKHDGSAFVTPVVGDFTLEATVDGDLSAQFDQVGVFLRVDEEHWLKAGVELDEELWLSAVHTNGASDWSREPWEAPGATLRLVREHGTAKVSILEPGGHWREYRIAYVPGAVEVGVYSCGPLGEGFAATASALTLEIPG